MLGHVDRGAAVFAAQGEPLQDADGDEDDGRQPAGGLVGGQQAEKAVEKPMMVRVMMKAMRRPTRSPMRPKKSAPKGRTRNPTAKVAR
jgi:hypothetical protein